MRIATGLSTILLGALAISKVAAAQPAPSGAPPTPPAPSSTPAAPSAAPGTPVAPSVPVAPTASTPVAPSAAPSTPVAPSAPVAPSVPVAPSASAPVAPAAPLAPAPGFVGTNPSGLPTAPVPAPAPASPAAPSSSFEFSTLRLLAAKGVLSQAEYDSAVKDLTESMGQHAANSSTLAFAKWKTTLYGFAQADMMYSSTQSFSDFAGNAQVARPDTFAGKHDRFTASIRNSRFGFRIQAPALDQIRATGVLEMDFLGTTGTIGSTVTEGSFFNNPGLRIRHAYLKVETPIVDVLFGQTWHVFGWQPNYIPTVVQWAGIAGEIFSRTTQLRLSRTIKTDAVNVEIAAAAMRPPERDSAVPEGEAGLRLTFNKWTSWHTSYMTGTALMPASIGVSGDLRYFRMPEFLAKPVNTNSVISKAIAVNAYIPVIPAKADKKDNSLSVIGEFVMGQSINDLYTGLTGGVANAALPNPDMKTPAPEYTSPTDPGLVVYDDKGTLRQPAWTTFLVGLEYYPPFVGGRVALFANFTRSQLQDAKTYPNPGKVRDNEIFIEGGVFVDPFESLRFGIDYAHIEDTYADGVKATNEAAQISGFFFF